MSTDCDENTDQFSKASTVVLDDVQSRSEHCVQKLACVYKPQEEIKKFLGGYKHKITGVTYLHVSTQTVPPPWNDTVIETFCRDAQTIETKDEIQQTARDASTQVQVRNIFIQTSNDDFLPSSDNYVYADDIQVEKLGKVVVMQKFVRRWLAQKELQKRKQSYLDKLAWEEEQKKVRKNQDSEWIKDLHKRKLDPIAEDDFMLLFSDLQNWWEHEVQTISETKSGPHQQEALWELVNKEVKKISEINKTKTVIENQKVFDQRKRLLSEAGEPKQWKTYKNNISVITAGTEKSQNLRNLYYTLSIKGTSTQDRLDVLQSLIQLLQRYNNNLTNTLLQLAQREVDLLLRGTRARNLEGLRSRIQDLFWQYVKQPRFNSEMHSQANLKKIDGSYPNVLCCASCKQFYTLPPSSANEAVGKSVLGSVFVKCKKCLYLENEGWIRKDVELYKKILKLLIDEEEQKATLSSLIYILQPCDIKHLVEFIWKRQSCLSGASDESDLELVRYNVQESWTPWNCILVTREEAAIMARIPNPQKTYDDNFKKFVYQRHVAARSYFCTIPRFLPYVTKSIIKDYTDSDDENV